MMEKKSNKSIKTDSQECILDCTVGNAIKIKVELSDLDDFIFRDENIKNCSER